MDKVKPDPDDKPLYYWENGLMVFTAEYHRRRGYCCRSGCRHCPYGYNKLDEKKAGSGDVGKPD